MSPSRKHPPSPEPLPPFGGHEPFWPEPPPGSLPRKPTPSAWRAHISGNDFLSAESFIAAAKKHEESSPEYEALLEIAVIRYARPFSENEKGKGALLADPRLKINPRKVLGSGADFELHRRIRTLSNKAIAHAEAEKYPVGLMGGAAPGRTPAIVSRLWHITQEKLDFDAFARISKKMRETCYEMMISLTRQP